MANPQNLIPQTKRSPSEIREMGKKGGIASGEARREKKRLKNGLLGALDCVSKDGKRTYREVINDALIAKAAKGDVRAYEMIRDTIGEKPVTRSEVTGKDGNPLIQPVLNVNFTKEGNLPS